MTGVELLKGREQVWHAHAKAKRKVGVNVANSVAVAMERTLNVCWRQADGERSNKDVEQGVVASEIKIAKSRGRRDEMACSVRCERGHETAKRTWDLMLKKKSRVMEAARRDMGCRACICRELQGAHRPDKPRTDTLQRARAGV